MSIELKARAIIRRGDSVLSYWLDDLGYRLPGGKIEFGEEPSQTVVRELKEELGLDVIVVAEPKVVNNLFKYRGCLRHEIVFFFECKFVCDEQYSKDAFPAFEIDSTRSFVMSWVDSHHVNNVA